MPREILPNGYYYTFLLLDGIFPVVFGTMTLLSPMTALMEQLPMGFDPLTDKFGTGHSARVALASILPGMMGWVWAITTWMLLPLAKNGMKDRPDLAEKVVRGHLISGAIADPFHLAFLLYYIPNTLLFEPSSWHGQIYVGFIWITVISALKIGWCAGIGRASAKEAFSKGE